MEKLFDNIARGITSLSAVLLVLLLVVTGMVFFSHTLFTSVFPPEMSYWERFAAAWVMALGWEATVLVTTVNVKHLNKNIPAIMAVCSGVIVLFFIRAFDADQNWLVIMQRWFVGLLAATINYIYADLFYAKFKERISVIEAPMKVIELESTVNQLQSTLNQTQSKLIEFDELKRFRSKVIKELTCPHCKTEQISFGSLHAHKGHCLSNPRKTKLT
jgi:hypothetical protein